LTHHDDTIFPAPAHLRLVPGLGDAPTEVQDVRLVVRGQGTVAFTLSDHSPFSVTIGDAVVWGSRAFRWDVGYSTVALFEWVAGAWERVHREVPDAGAGTGLDPDPACTYWFSVDGHNRRLSYGTGEPRLKTVLASHDICPPQPDAPDPYEWLERLGHVRVTPAVQRPTDVWRDPVTVDPAMKVVPTDAISMAEMAAGELTVPANLTPACQMLYGNVAGKRFVLNPDDFEHFGDAIQASIDDPEGWCAKTLLAKSTEFGPSNPAMTYLRITMGLNQGESPGIPFVMEIWPSGHYSPIHNHSAADAVIRVLRGEICVSLYRMLSPHHTVPFTNATFREGDVTWISPTLNQTHMLKNEKTPACITIQCYAYDASDRTHYPYFDYLSEDAIGHFTPNCDMDYLEFKALMQQEWDTRSSTSSPDRPLASAST
jgi:uncharacterized cupin superfamily protein